MSKALNLQSIIARAKCRLETTEYIPQVTIHQEARTLAELNEVNIQPHEWSELMGAIAKTRRTKMN